MIRYTTPTFTLTVSGVDMSDDDVYVSFNQGSIVLTKTGDDVTVSYSDDDDATTITVMLEQSESALFELKGKVVIQVNWITSDGVRYATKPASAYVKTNLFEEVIEYGE